MFGLMHMNTQFRNANEMNRSSPCETNSDLVSVWLDYNCGDGVGLQRLPKFWSDLTANERWEMLRIDKHNFFEQVRKKMYCSRCTGFLLRCFSQMVTNGKSLQQEGRGSLPRYKTGALANVSNRELDDVEDPSIHPWGGLVVTRDGILTLMDCYLYGQSLNALQNVFKCAQEREHERGLQFPDACGGACRGWSNHGMTNYGRVPWTRETCALHNSRISFDTLVDFYSTLSSESQLNLLRMKEEDFIEKLVYRFDIKRFCRDCRRNVIREFKKLKDLKRKHRETRCTDRFCMPDSAFQYEVTEDTVQANWHESFVDTVNSYHHFEWAIGTNEGQSDILEFEDVGMSEEVQVNGLDLGRLEACFITLRAWRLDGHCTELTVKAHALKWLPCVHRWLIVGDGFVTITILGSIRMVFAQAEKAEKEEEEDGDGEDDEDGDDLGLDGSRRQKHAKSPKLAREFLLHASMIIFKEQVENAFRESIARQNAHNTFVFLALKLLEERLHVAFKSTIALEMQRKLIEEDEKEKCAEEERKERKKTKERERKLRRKGKRMLEKEKEKARKEYEVETFPSEPSKGIHEEHPTTIVNSEYSFGEEVQDTLTRPHSPDIINTNSNTSVILKSHDNVELKSYEDANDSFLPEQSKTDGRKQFKNCQLNLDDEANVHHNESEMKTNVYPMCSLRSYNRERKYLRGNTPRTPIGNHTLKNSDKLHNHPDYEATSNTSRQVYGGSKYNHGWHASNTLSISKLKTESVTGHMGRSIVSIKEVYREPADSRKKCHKNRSDIVITLEDNPSDSSSIGSNPIKTRYEEPQSGTPQESRDNKNRSTRDDGYPDEDESNSNPSCLTEEGSNSSNSCSGNPDSSSTSDLEDNIQQLEGHGEEINNKNRTNDMTATCTSGFSGGGINIGGNNKPTQNVQEVSSHSTQYVSDMTLQLVRQPQMAPMPYISAPSMMTHHQYCHQCKLPYSSPITPLSQSHQYMPPIHVIYYPSVPNLSSEFYKPPMYYQAVEKVDVMESEEKMKKKSCMNENTSSFQSIDIPSNAGTSEVGNNTLVNYGKLQRPPFSLFHSGGPVASSKNKPVLEEEEIKNRCFEGATSTGIENYSLFNRKQPRFLF